MITKQEIDEMLANLPAAQEKMRCILNWASAYGDLIGTQWTRREDYDKLAEQCAAWKAEAERWRKVAENQDGGTYVRVIQERDNWRHDCEQMSRDTQYYRDLVYRVGQLLGEEVKICDDGVNCGEILVDKVPEVAQKTLFQYGEFAREVASALGLSDYAFNLKETVEYLKKRLNEVQHVDELKRSLTTMERSRDTWKDRHDSIMRHADVKISELSGDVERYNRLWDEACDKLCAWEEACRAKDADIDALHKTIDGLEAESKRLHELWHSCEVVITEAASIVGACARNPNETLVAACRRVMQGVRSVEQIVSRL